MAALDKNYTYDPLANPEKQVRLLQILPGDQEDDLQITISTWNLDNTPRFYGISYTWGKEEYRRIRINGRVFDVWKNCGYALWQARIHYPGEYVWIDQVSIDQKDSKEKGRQVGIMGLIYQKACGILACVGPHADDSELLVELVAEVRTRDIKLRDCPRAMREADGYFDVALRSLPRQVSEDVERFYLAVEAFIDRGYWGRLWILQELAAGTDTSVDVLCGEHSMPRNCLDLLVDMWCDIDVRLHNDPADDERHRTASAYGETIGIRIGSLSVNEVMDKYFRFNCSDQRDRIYSILPLLTQTEPCRQIVPDYTISLEELAAQACSRVKLDSVGSVLDALEFHGSHPGLRRFVARRQKGLVSSYQKIATSTYGPIKMTCTRFSLGADGVLTVPLSHDGTPLGNDPLQDEIGSPSNDVTKEGRYKPVHMVEEPYDLVGLACSNAKVEDVLVPWKEGHYEHQVLVVRRAKNQVYDTIGQMIVVQDRFWEIARGALAEENNNVFDVDAELRMSGEDAVVLAAQDWSPDRSERLHSRFERLITNPVLSPLNAVTLKPRKPVDTDDESQGS